MNQKNESGIILTNQKDKPRAKSRGEEAKLQASIHVWYTNHSGYDSRTLWATFNEGEGVGKKRAMGLVDGVSDLLRYDGLCLAGIEVKVLGEYHEVERLRKQPYGS